LILTDTGPLVALIDARDDAHERVHAVPNGLHDLQMVTTWPCFTEAMYLVDRVGGYRLQMALWQLRADGLLNIHEIANGEADRMRTLMTIYRDIPMDLADASLVAAAEARADLRIFTIDRHFYAYRADGGRAFDVVQ